MSKKKDSFFNGLIKKKFDKEPETLGDQLVEALVETVEAKETNEETKETQLECYVTTPNPYKGGRNYVILKINYSLQTQQAYVVDIRELHQKEVGMAFPLEQENLKYFYEKSVSIKGSLK